MNRPLGVADAQESSLDASIDIESQLKRGKHIVITISDAQPYGKQVQRDKTILGVANTLLEKALGNIKADQFASQNTFLVLNLGVIPPLVTEPNALTNPQTPNSLRSVGQY